MPVTPSRLLICSLIAFFCLKTNIIMPNHVKNRLTIHAKGNKLKQIVDQLSTHFDRTPNKAHDGTFIYKHKAEKYNIGWWDEKNNIFSQRNKDDLNFIPKDFEQDFDEAWTRFPDFEKVFPMPESLHIESSGTGELGYTIISGISNNRFMSYEHCVSRFMNLNEHEKIKAIELGLKFYKNKINHGHCTWYDWSIENWGTKWNGYDNIKLSENVFEFSTAWSSVPLIIEKISDMFKDVEFTYEYSDEDTGSNVGYATAKNGLIDLTRLEDSSKEAYELAFKLDPDSKSCYSFIEGKYTYNED